jgi:hypothetical protein
MATLLRASGLFHPSTRTAEVALTNFKREIFRPVVMGENPSNHVLVDLGVERHGDLLDDSRTAPAGITLLHFGDRMNEV